MPEREIWSDTFSAKGLIHVWALLSLATAGVALASFVVPGGDRLWWRLLVLSPIAWLVGLVYLFYLKLDVDYVLTNQRLIHRHGILLRDHRRIEVIDIDDVGYRQHLLEWLVGVGTVEIFSSDLSDPILELRGIDQVRDVARVIDEARRAERVRRGIHIEAV